MAQGAVAALGLQEALGLKPQDIPEGEEEAMAAVTREIESVGDKDAVENWGYVVSGGTYPSAVAESLKTGVYHGGAIGPNDFDTGHAGQDIRWWLQRPEAIMAKLTKVEMAVLRFYSSSSFWRLTGPMRSLQVGGTPDTVAAEAAPAPPATSSPSASAAPESEWCGSSAGEAQSATK